MEEPSRPASGNLAERLADELRNNRESGQPWTDKPQLRFASEEDAEAARKRLAQRLPNSEPVWVITQEVGKIEDWAQR